MNPKNEDDKCFQYAERIQKGFQTLNRLWINIIGKKINYLSKINDSKKFKKLIQELLSIFCILEKKVLPAYISNHNSTHEKTIIILMIPDKDIMALFCSKKKRKKPTFLRWITSKHQ